MIGLLLLFLIFYIGNQFYKLAGIHGKTEWKYAGLGIVLYFVFQFFGGIAYLFFMPNRIVVDLNSEDILGLYSFAFLIGGICIFLTYLFLKNRWRKGSDISLSNDDILDDTIFMD